MAVDWGDAAAWFGAGLSLVMSALALRQSARAADSSHRSADASETSAQASVRAADAAERQAAAAEAALPPPPPAVDWLIRLVRAGRHGGGLYELRNVGAGTATGVQRVEVPNQNLVRLDLGDGTFRPNGSVEFTVVAVAQLPDVREIALIWDGQPTPVLVPLT